MLAAAALCAAALGWAAGARLLSGKGVRAGGPSACPAPRSGASAESAGEGGEPGTGLAAPSRLVACPFALGGFGCLGRPSRHRQGRAGATWSSDFSLLTPQRELALP